MAHFAEINSSNVVQRCIVISNEDVVANGGDYTADVESWVKTKFGGHAWLQCSYNKNVRGEFPGKSWHWSPTKSKFYEPRPIDYHELPCDACTLNADTLQWDYPVTAPTFDQREYIDEEDGIKKQMVSRWEDSSGKWRGCKDGFYGNCLTEWYWNPSTSSWDEIT
tara:strand:- start:3578 stop:4072 length:495 start_codon:yes stop_codon:yes gene_type:complete